MNNYIIIDKKNSQFLCRLSTGSIMFARQFEFAEQFETLSDVRNFLLDEEIEECEVYIIKQVNFKL